MPEDEMPQDLGDLIETIRRERSRFIGEEAARMLVAAVTMGVEEVRPATARRSERPGRARPFFSASDATRAPRLRDARASIRAYLGSFWSVQEWILIVKFIMFNRYYYL